MKRVEALRIGGHAAPLLRKPNTRRVHVVNKDGDVIRTETLGEIQRMILSREAIEFGRVEDVRPPTEETRGVGDMERALIAWARAHVEAA